MPANIRDTDRGARRVLERYTSTRSRKVVDVGVIGSNASRVEPGEGETSPVTVADSARWSEFGIGQPMRSWLRGWYDENRDALYRQIRLESKAIHEKNRTKDQALERIGLFVVGGIQARIARGISPPNAQSTIDKKGSSTPLIDKGQFRSSITSMVRNP